MTNLHRLKPGDGMNLEFDVIAKYVERMIAGGAAIEAKKPRIQEFKNCAWRNSARGDFFFLNSWLLGFSTPSLLGYLRARLLDFGPTFFRFTDFPPERSWASRVLAPFSFALSPALGHFPLPLLVDQRH